VCVGCICIDCVVFEVNIH